MKTITVKEALELKNAVFIDTRTPKEYEIAHIPGAINIPLFSDEQRHIIGILYKNQGKETAVNKGLEFVSLKLPDMIKEYSKYKDKLLIIYCWRGGMRSKSVTSLLDSIGFNVLQLENGHKEFRRHVLEYFSKLKLKPCFIVLYGLTGTGKTEILKKILLPKIDLEDLAQHRSSLLGSINLKPRTQIMFDALLFNRLRTIQNEKYVFIEGESRKIGSVEMPDFLWRKCKEGINIKISCPLKNRISRLVKEYTPINDETKKQLFSILDRLKQKLSGAVVDKLKQCLETKDYDTFTKIMLEKYYDPLYQHTVENIKYDYTVDFEKIEDAIHELEKIFNRLK